MNFHTSPFDYMASPLQAASELSPAETERMVREYLENLSQAVSEESFDPTGGVNALVFGEWGHGKSQVMYRTAAHLTRHHPHVLTVRIIAARLAPRDILEAALFDLGRQPSTSAEADVIRRSLVELGDMADVDPRARQLTAGALANMAAQASRLHTALLFDEAAQTSGIDFQEFLRDLERAFTSQRVIIHTMQCHSLATLDRARTIANNLGDWAREAKQIHLPSIQQEDAYEFFHKRLSTRTDDQGLAAELIPEGIAKTLCAAAGGNPRRMLQYASRIWELCRDSGEQRFTGSRVLDVFSRETGVIAGTSLFMEPRFRRILDLLPQEWGAFGHRVRPFLERNIAKLLGESEVISPGQLSAELGNVPVGELQKITHRVGGIPLFEPKKDEFEDTTYGLTHAFRADLCGAFGSTGGLDLKQIQIRLLLKPREEQIHIATGLATVLQNNGYTPTVPKLVTLGEFPAGAHSHHRTPIRGFAMQTRIPDTTVDIPILVTGLCGAEPASAMVERVVRGIREREWLFAYILYTNEQLSWDDWLKGDEAKALLRDLQDNASAIRALNLAEKLVLPAAMEHAHQPSVAAAIFFANIVGAGQLYDSGRAPLAEMVPIIVGTCNTMLEERPRLSDVCYLPTDVERKILDHSCWEQSSGTEGLNLKQLSEATQQKLTGPALANLLEGYLEKRGSLYIRKKIDSFPLFTVVRDALKARQKCSMDALVEDVRDAALFVGGSDRLRNNIEWTVEKLQVAGFAKRDQLAKRDMAEIQYVDLVKALKDKDQQYKALLADCTKRLTPIKEYDSKGAEPLQVLLEGIRNKRKTKNGGQDELSERLDGLIQELEQLKGRIEERERSIESEKQKHLDHFAHEIADLKRLREELPPEWQLRAFTEEQYADVERLVEEFRRELEDPVAAIHKSIIKRERDSIQNRFDALRARVSGQAEAPPDDPYAQIVARVLSKKPFDRLVITVEI